MFFHLFQFNKQEVVTGMKKAFEKYRSTMSYDEFVNVIVDKLKTSGQFFESELFDLLGYEYISFIEYLINYRKQVIAWHSNQKLTRTFASKLTKDDG